MKRNERAQEILAKLLATVMLVTSVIGGSGGYVHAAETDPDPTEEAAVFEEADDADVYEAAEEDVSDTSADDRNDDLTDTFEDGGTYDIWVGGVQVTDENKMSIPGVTSGRVSYDPSGKTLTFKGVRGFKGTHEDASHNEAFVYAGSGTGELIIRGDAGFSLTKAGMYGFYLKDQAKFNADLTIDGKSPAIGCESLLTISGGSYKLQTNVTPLHANYLTVTGGTVQTETTGDSGISTNKEFNISGGEVTATGNRYGVYCGELRISGGKLTATAAGTLTDMNSADDDSYSGVSCDSAMVFAGSLVAKGQNHGVYAEGNITVDEWSSKGSINAEVTYAGTGYPPGKNMKTWAVVSETGDIVVNHGWLTAKGYKYGGAVCAEKGSISYTTENGVGILNPSGGGIYKVPASSDDYVTGSSILTGSNSSYAVSEGVIGEEPERYDLTVGGKEINSSNKDNIPVKSGHAFYDPATKTLTFENAVVETHKGIDMSEAIWTGDDLTIQGKVTINKVDDSGYGILLEGEHTLTLENAAIEALGMKYSAISVPYGNITIRNCDLNVSSTEDNGKIYNSAGSTILAGYDLRLERSQISATGKVRAISFNDRFSDTAKLKLEDIRIASPAGAYFSTLTVVLKSEIAKSVQFVPHVSYGVWVGGTLVTSDNMDDVRGDGKVSYDPDTSTLTFDAVNDLSGYTVTHNSLIYAVHDLRIEGSLRGTHSTARYGIFAPNLTIAGDIELRMPSYCFYAGQVTIERGKIVVSTSNVNTSTIQGEIGVEITGGNLTVGGWRGVCSQFYDIVIHGGTVYIASTNNCLNAYNIEITGGYIKGHTEKGRAISCEHTIVSENMRILTPEDSGGQLYGSDFELCEKGTMSCKVTFDMGGHGTQVTAQTMKDGGKAVKPEDPTEAGWLFAGWYEDDGFSTKFDFGKEIVKDITLYAKWYERSDDYELWLGDKLVNDKNCQDIFDDGTASYDPTTKTLTLNKYTGGDGTVCTATELDGKKALIFSKQDLTIVGSAKLESTEANYGIMVIGGTLTLDADLDITINSSGSDNTCIRTSKGSLIVNGKTVTCSCIDNEDSGSYGIIVQGEKFEINDGTVTSNGSCTGVSTRKVEETGAKMIINGGKLESHSTDNTYESSYGMYLSGQLEINAGTLIATNRKNAIYFGRANIEWENVKIVKPEGGDVNEDKYTIVKSDGITPAEEVELQCPQYTVNFNLGDKTILGTAPAEQKVYKGKKAVKPVYEPEAMGYSFKGWYREAACTSEFVFDDPITSDTTIYAKWNRICTVNFDVGEVPIPAPDSVDLEEGEKVTEPSAPEYEGRIFKGWYVNPADATAYDFNTPVTLDLNLHAKWEKGKHTVSFNLNGKGGTAPAVQTPTDGDLLTKPEDPVTEDFRFIGWYRDAEGQLLYDFSNPVTESMTLYARWIEKSAMIYYVAFDLNGREGTIPDGRYVADGEKAAKPEDPVCEGFVFTGWYTDRECTKLYDFDSPVTSDLVLFAGWISEDAAVWTVTFDLNEKPGIAPAAQKVGNGKTAVKPGDPAFEGYVFGGWYTDKTCTSPYDFSTPVTEDITLYAKWTVADGNNEESDKGEPFTAELPGLVSDPYEGIKKDGEGKYSTVYTGEPVKPVPAVYGPDGARLSEGEDYTVKYSNNTKVSTDDKKATVTITGKGNYSGKVVMEIDILPVDLKTAKEKGLLVVSDVLAVSGKKASATLIYRGIKLKAKKNYTLSNTSKIKADGQKTDIIGKGIFAGSKLEGLDILLVSGADKKKLTLKASVSTSKSYNGAEHTLDTEKGELVVKNGNGDVLAAGKDYAVTYYDNGDAGKAKVVITGIGEYARATAAAKTFAIAADKKSEMTISAPASILYSPDGLKAEIAVSLVRDGKTVTLVKGADYTVSLKRIKKSLKAKYKVQFKGNYKGHAAKSGSITIERASLAGAAVYAGEMVYKKPGKYNPAPMVAADGKLLGKNDYSVKYYDGTADVTKKKITFAEGETVKTIRVEVTGKGGYLDSTKAETSFILAKLPEGKTDITGAEVTVENAEYTGSPLTPAVKIDGKAADPALFRLIYVNNINRGTGYVIVTGNGTDTFGSKRIGFKINPKKLTAR